MTDYTLLTGATGLLGRYLLRDLLLSGHRVVIVARASKRQAVAERVESLMQMWEEQLGKELPRPVCMEGDLGQEHLGLSKTDRKWLTEHCSRVLHSAAALKFQEEADGEPWKTNVGGTRHVLDLCHEVDVREIHYVSTAYVCGNREGRIYENELDLGQSFRNPYEESKLQAETLVRQDDFFEKTTVYRPAVIAGDSQTGYTNTYHGLFMYLQLMCVLARNTEPGPDGVRHTCLDLHITGDEPRNVIPVDWTSEVICHLFSTPEAHGQTFHLSPSKRMTAREMVEAGYTYFNSTGVNFVGPAAEIDHADGLGQDAFENSGMYREYEASDPEFDTTNLERFAGHIPCPEIDETMLHKFMKYGEDDRWGKRRESRAEIPFSVANFLRDWQEEPLQDALASQVANERVVGLDVLGPGGGQWTLTVAQGRLVTVASGIPRSLQAVWQVSVNEFAKLAHAIDMSVVSTCSNKQLSTRSSSDQFEKLSDRVIAASMQSSS